VLSYSSAAALWKLLLQQEGGRGGRLLPTYPHNIPVTTTQRTIDDLEGTVAPYLLRRARRQAELMNVRLRGAEGKRLRSDPEEEFLRFCRHRFPLLQANVKIGPWEVDFLWREQRLAVEIDSFVYHRGSIAFEDEHARDLDLRQRGFTVLRFS
jgi:very-short-patch-repair endonuclease